MNQLHDGENCVMKYSKTLTNLNVSWCQSWQK